MSGDRPQYGASPGGEVPVCPRHPDRPSYVACQRCGRPVCPQCQRPAAVGVHCVDCVAEAARSRPVHRTSLGGRVPRGSALLVTWTLIGVNTAVYALQWLAGLLGLNLTAVASYAPFLTASEPWRMLTSGFLHSVANPLHLVLNMYMLHVFGQMLEPALGRVRFLLLFLVSVLGGSLGVLVLAPPFTFVVGASGGIFGLFGALFVLQRHLGRSITPILVLIGVNVVFGFVFPGIAWQAHLGGLAAGALVALAYTTTARRRSGR
ncbi:rhomboid family intramembrane serine protease [Kocuria flava]|uniref:Rhomboid family intramembrane serine protease n=1 Tax=Kocuria flava TaxID=446860 RepID=A0A0U3GHJ2_9MICC|nr:rhomboid family intramembrane serine protease [Kocuria flava]ALU38851.1 rhomboid family intramembrane serine protease [Kocuria flava]GEO91120.1 rhomboid family intramembrane serine protease [Kocuria flava]